jgi:zinc protease
MINRKFPPVPDSEIPFEKPNIQRFNVGDSLEILHVQKNNLPIVYSELILDAGSKFDLETLGGTANLTSLLIDEGAAEFTSLQLSEQFEKLGTVFQVNADTDTLNFSILSLSEYFERSIELLSKVLFEPRFSQADFDREKKKVLDKITQLKDNPSYTASTVFEKILFKDTFYEFPEIGYYNSVLNIKRDDILSFYENRTLKSKMILIVVGNVGKSDLEILINKYFAGKSRTSISSQPMNDIFLPSPKNKFYLVHKEDSTQSELRIGHSSFKRNSPDFPASKIMNTILGGQFSSRINLNLREKRGITYGATSSFHFYINSGWFEISTSVNVDNTGEAVSEIFKEIKGIKESILDSEIEFSKSTIIKQFPSRFETYSQIARNIETVALHSLQFSDLFEHPNQIANTNNDEVRSAAQKHVKPEEAVVVIVGDRSKVISQISSISNNIIELTEEGELLRK